MIVNADILEWARTYDGPKFHALLCDPPYHLHDGKGAGGFMNKQWDGEDIAFRPETWAALAEHLHPGGFIMAFASSRGWHRLAVAIEDAGLRIHPSIFGWAFGSGFPKATRIDTQIDKAAGADREVVGRYVSPENTSGGKGRKFCHGGQPLDGLPIITAPATPLAAAWEGHRYGGQALKPALEPIIVAQKPYVGRPVDSITATGAGALWVDGGRVESGGLTYRSDGVVGGGRERAINLVDRGDGKTLDGRDLAKVLARTQRYRDNATEKTVAGRWPPNLVLCHTPECERVGVRRVRGKPVGDYQTVKTSKGHPGGSFGADSARRPNGHEYTDKLTPRYADADGLELVAAYACAPGCPVAMVDGIDSSRDLCYTSCRNGGVKCGEQCDQNAAGDVENTCIGESREAGEYTDSLHIGGNGNASTGRSHPDTISTTKTGIASTTISPISQCSTTTNTSDYTTPSAEPQLSATDCACVQHAGNGCPSRITTGTSGGETCNQSASGVPAHTFGNGEKRTSNTSRPSGGLNTKQRESAAGPSRFFPNPDYSLDIAERIAAADPVAYVAKASRAERSRGLPDGQRSHHPTVKPLALARWLATLLLPPDAYAPRRILIPFAGSGSECIGAMLAGWEEIVGIEREAEYVAIAEARLAWWAANRDKAPEVRAMGDKPELAKQPNGRPPKGITVAYGRFVGNHRTNGHAPPPTVPMLPGMEAAR